MYIVMLEWYNEELDDLEKESRLYFFESCESATALEFAHDIAYDKDAWERYDRPKSIYLYEVKNAFDICPNIYWSEDQGYLAAWVNCDKYLKE